MGFFRFRKSVKIFPGLKLNINKKSVSLTGGTKGFHHTVGTKGSQTTVGIPGTGLSYTQHQTKSKQTNISQNVTEDTNMDAMREELANAVNTSTPPPKKKGGCLKRGLQIIAAIIVLRVIFSMFGGESFTPIITGLDKEQNTAVVNTLNNCGFSSFEYEIKEAKDLDAANEKGYKINLKNQISNINLYLTKDKAISKIIANQQNVIYANQKVVTPITTYYLSDKDFENLKGIVQTTIKQSLSTQGVKDVDKNVKFYGNYDWHMSKATDGTIKVSSYMVATNPQGEQRRYDFAVTIDKNGKIINYQQNDKNANKIPKENSSTLKKIIG